MPSNSITANVVASLAADVVRKGKKVRLLVHGSCMNPAIATGDQVIVAPTTAHDIRVGDVVVVVDNRNFVHRVVRIDREAGFLVTKGDNCAVEDAPAKIGAVIGTVVRVKRPLLLQMRRVVSRIRRSLKELLTT